MAVAEPHVVVIAVEGHAEIGVAEAVKGMFSVQESTQELDIFPSRGIEAGIAAIVHPLGAGDSTW